MIKSEDSSLVTIFSTAAFNTILFFSQVFKVERRERHNAFLVTAGTELLP